MKITIIEKRFEQLFSDLFPKIEISCFRYGNEERVNHIHYLIPSENAFLKGSVYYFDASAYNSFGRCLNMSRPTVTGTVPEEDTFSVIINCICRAAEFVASVELKANTTEATLVDSVLVELRQINTIHQPVIELFKTDVVASPTKDTTVTLSGMIYLIESPAATTFATKFRIPCTDGSEYSGTANVDVYPGIPCSVNVVLTRYDPNGGLGKVIVNFIVPALFQANVTFPN